MAGLRYWVAGSGAYTRRYPGDPVITSDNELSSFALFNMFLFFVV